MCESMSELTTKTGTLPEGFAAIARSRLAGAGDWAKKIKDLASSGAGSYDFTYIDFPYSTEEDSPFMQRAKSVRGILSKAATDLNYTISATIVKGGKVRDKQIPGLSSKDNGVIAWNLQKLTDAQKAKRKEAAAKRAANKEKKDKSPKSQ